MKVSVCLATYNGAQFIKEQVVSILEQRFENFPNTSLELIVSDDKSIDETVTILERLHDNRIKIVTHEPKRYRHYNNLISATKNFENALQYASGDYIFLSDQDDVWYPNKIDTMLKFLQNKSCCICSFDWINQYGDYLGQTIHSKNPLSFWKIIKHFPYYGFCIGFNRQFKERILPFPIIAQHDYFIGLVATLKEDLIICDEALCAHRKYLDNSSKSNVSDSGFSEPLYVKLLYRFKLVFYSIVRGWRR